MKTLKELYEDPKLGNTSDIRFYQNIKDTTKYTMKDVEIFFKTLPAAQIHNDEKPYYIPIEVSGIREQYQIDLVVLIKGQKRDLLDFEKIKKNELRYIFTLIDVFSRKANCRYLKNKTADLTAEALKEMIDEMGMPVQISGDKRERNGEEHSRGIVWRMTSN